MPSIRIELAEGETALLEMHVRQAARRYGNEVEPIPQLEASLLEQQRRSDALQYSFLGVLFALMVYKLFLFLSLRSRSYAWYVAFLMAVGTYWATQRGYVLIPLWPASWTTPESVNFYALVIAAICYGWFVRHFLHTRRTCPRIDPSIRAVVGVWLFSGVLAAVGAWTLAERVAAVSGLLLILLTLAAGIGAHRQGFRPARYYLVAAGAFLGVAIVYVGLYFVSPSQTSRVAGVLQAAMLGEALLLAIALAMRLRILNEARMDALRARDVAEARSESLEAANELKTRLLGIAAHDLRSPLSTVVGYADMIEFQTPRRSDLHELTGAIQRSASRMLTLIEDLLVTSAVDSGAIQLVRERVDFRQLVEDILGTHEQRAIQKGQTVVADLAPVAVRGDRVRLDAIVDNLVSNAIKYSPEGGRIEVSLDQVGERACLAIQDSGPGFTKEDLALLFQPFQRLSAQPTAGEASTGLGLSIAKQLVDLHEGQIEVDTTPGEGSVFTVWLDAVASPRETDAGTMLVRAPSTEKPHPQSVQVGPRAGEAELA